MSWQVAFAGISAAASVAGTVASMAGAKGKGAMNNDSFTAQGNAARRQAAQMRDQATEVETQTAIEEQKRLDAYEMMMAANMADLPTRGVTDSASFDAIMRHNKDSTGQDLLAVRYMGSAKASRLRASADANEEAANIFYQGGAAALSQGDTESASALARGGWQLANSMPNMVSSFGKMKDSWDLYTKGATAITRVSSTPEPFTQTS